MKKFWILCLLFSSVATAAPWQVASRLQTFYNGERPLTSRIYYPTSAQGQRQQVGGSSVFAGISALPDAPPATGHFPLLIISHGSGGNNSSQAWLASALAQQGVIVIAANHPGSTTGDSIPASSLELWQQTRDISALIDAMLKDSIWQPRINPQAIGVAGHSKGGYSAISAIGGQVTLEDFITGCQRQPHSPNCQFYAGVNKETISATAFDANYTDTRIRFAIALDPGMVPYLQPASLRKISAPLLVIAAQHFMPGNDPQSLGAASLAGYSGQQPIKAIILPGSSHFDFLQLCTPAAPEILAEEGEAFICGSSPDERERTHQQTIAAVLTFIQPWLPAPAGNQ